MLRSEKGERCDWMEGTDRKGQVRKERAHLKVMLWMEAAAFDLNSVILTAYSATCHILIHQESNSGEPNVGVS